jgi:hypothetical protein
MRRPNFEHVVNAFLNASRKVSKKSIRSVKFSNFCLLVRVRVTTTNNSNNSSSSSSSTITSTSTNILY